MREYSFYYGAETEQFNFLQFPKAFIRDSRYEGISTDAKLLYCILRERMTLSRRNGWLDQENRVYIIYTISDVSKELGCSVRKANMLMAELYNEKLIEKRRQGQGKPNIIYVKNFIIEDESAVNRAEIVKEQDKSVKKRSSGMRGDNMQFSEVQDLADQEVQNLAGQEVQNLAGQEVQNFADQEVQNLAGQEVQNLHTSNTDISYKDINNIYISINHITEIFKERISYDVLVHDEPENTDVIDGVLSVMVDAYCSKRSTLTVNGEERVIQDIRRNLMKIDMFHVKYILDSLVRSGKEIRNVRAYMLTSLYNAPLTIDLYYKSLYSP